VECSSLNSQLERKVSFERDRLDVSKACQFLREEMCAAVLSM
jgi:hypothetical protein